MGIHGDEARRQYLAAKLAAHTATDGERDEAIGKTRAEIDAFLDSIPTEEVR